MAKSGTPGWRTPLENILGNPSARSAEVLVAGRDILETLQSLPRKSLPELWRETFPETIVVGADTTAMYTAIGAARQADKRIVVLCSGDALFFGLGARLAERFGRKSVQCLPGTSSLQGAAAFLGLPWEIIRAVSLHGRSDRAPLAQALFSGSAVFVLCDKVNTPTSIAGWLRERGQDAYTMHVLENLHHTNDGSIRPMRHDVFSVAKEFPSEEGMDGKAPRVIVLVPDTGAVEAASTASPWFGLDDAAFVTEKGLITKGPVRAAVLAALAIAPTDTVWDLGAGSGAVSVEASRIASMGRVFAVEGKAERIACIEENRRRFGAANMEIVHGNLPDCIPSYSDGSLDRNGVQPSLARPDRIFIGGGLGTSAEAASLLVRRAWDALLPSGRLVAACVLLSSLETARTTLAALGANVTVQCIQSSDSAELGADIHFKAHNPVFLVRAIKP